MESQQKNLQVCAKGLATSKALVTILAQRSSRGVRRVHEQEPVPEIAGWMPSNITSHKIDALRMLLSQLWREAAIGSCSSSGVNKRHSATRKEKKYKKL